MPTKYQGTDEQRLALDTFIKLTRANSALESRMIGRGTMGELTISQFGVLEVLLHLGPMCPGELSQKLLKSTGNMTLVIDNLEKRGLVHRERSAQDRRMITIALTGQGRSLIEGLFPNHVDAIVEEMSVLSAAEQEQLSMLLKKLGLGVCQSALRAGNPEGVGHQPTLETSGE